MESPAPRRAASIASRPGRLALQLLGVLAVAGCVLVNVVDPYSGVTASQQFTVALAPGSALPKQTLTSSHSAIAISRDGYAVTEAPKPVVVPAALPADTGAKSKSAGWAPPAGPPDPGSAQAIAAEMVAARGWGTAEYDCLVALWSRESGWRYNAYNAGSGAYGIPQSLPGNKMASVAPDWETNPATQITWGLGYITGRYSSPCGAWAHSESAGWY